MKSSSSLLDVKVSAFLSSDILAIFTLFYYLSTLFNLSNFRPISNLPFLGKALEKVVYSQVISMMNDHSLFEKFQSGFLIHHQTESVLLFNDMRMNSVAGCCTVLVLLDLSDTFNKVFMSPLRQVCCNSDVSFYFYVDDTNIFLFIASVTAMVFGPKVHRDYINKMPSSQGL